MTEATKLSAVAEDRTVQPFRVDTPEAALIDLRKRISETRWPEKETVADASQGVQLATIEALARYWAEDYDWRECEAKLNALPQFTTVIDGLDGVGQRRHTQNSSITTSSTKVDILRRGNSRNCSRQSCARRLVRCVS